MVRHSQRNGVSARAYRVGDSLASPQYEGQRTRPEALHQSPHGVGYLYCAPFDVVWVGQQERERVTGRASLEPEYAFDGGSVKRTCREAVEGIGRDGYDAAILEDFDGGLDLVLQGLTWPENG